MTDIEIQIPSEPEKYVIFGDYCLAYYIAHRVVIIDEVRKVQLMFRPTDWMRWRYNIQNSAYNNEGNVVQLIDEENFIIVDNDSFMFKVRVLVDYDGKECEVEDNINEKNIRKLRVAKEQVAFYRKRMLFFQHQLRKLGEEPNVLMSRMYKKFTEQFVELSKAESKEKDEEVDTSV